VATNLILQSQSLPAAKVSFVDTTLRQAVAPLAAECGNVGVPIVDVVD